MWKEVTYLDDKKNKVISSEQGISVLKSEIEALLKDFKLIKEIREGMYFGVTYERSGMTFTIVSDRGCLDHFVKFEGKDISLYDKDDYFKKSYSFTEPNIVNSVKKLYSIISNL